MQASPARRSPIAVSNSGVVCTGTGTGSCSVTTVPGSSWISVSQVLCQGAATCWGICAYTAASSQLCWRHASESPSIKYVYTQSCSAERCAGGISGCQCSTPSYISAVSGLMPVEAIASQPSTHQCL